MKKSSLIIILILALPLLAGLNVNKESGTFIYRPGSKVEAEEDFTVEKLDNGKIRISSEFIARSEKAISEYATANIYSQVFNLNSDFELISYLMRSETAEGKMKVQVNMDDTSATVSTTWENPKGKEDTLTEEAPTGDRIVIAGVSGVQLMILQRIIEEKPELKYPKDVLKLIALNPSNLLEPLLEVDIQQLTPTLLAGGTEILNARRFGIKINDFFEDKDILLESFSHEGKLLGFYLYSGNSKMVIYRADLFPNGFF